MGALKPPAIEIVPFEKAVDAYSRMTAGLAEAKQALDFRFGDQNQIKEKQTMSKEAATQIKEKPRATHEIPTDLNHEGVTEITTALRPLLADAFALYLKTKNFHWHMTGQHFRDYHLLLDEHSEQIFAMTDEIAERARKIGGTTLRSISDISRHQRLKDNNDESVAPKEMLAELSADNQALTRYFRSAHNTCDKYNDVATASLIEVWTRLYRAHPTKFSKSVRLNAAVWEREDLFQVRRKKCVQKEFDRADIVRDVRLRRYSGVRIFGEITTQFFSSSYGTFQDGVRARGAPRDGFPAPVGLCLTRSTFPVQAGRSR